MPEDPAILTIAGAIGAGHSPSRLGGGAGPQMASARRAMPDIKRRIGNQIIRSTYPELCCLPIRRVQAVGACVLIDEAWLCWRKLADAGALEQFDARR